MINPNGLYPHVPSHATEFELALALIFKTGSTLLVHHWQPGAQVRVRQPLLITEHADMLEQYYGKLHNHCLQAYSKITVHN